MRRGPRSGYIAQEKKKKKKIRKFDYFSRYRAYWNSARQVRRDVRLFFISLRLYFEFMLKSASKKRKKRKKEGKRKTDKIYFKGIAQILFMLVKKW